MTDNCLQYYDHWITIISGIFTIILTSIATWLTIKTYLLDKRDKKKTIAINELQEQTKKLKELFLYQIQPRFITKHGSTGHLYIVNVGGDCFNLSIENIDGDSRNKNNPFDKWPDHFSSMSEKSFSHGSHGDKNFLFMYEDRHGNKMEQIYDNRLRKFSNVKMN